MALRKAISRRRFLGGSRAEELCRIAPPGATAKGLEDCTGCGDCAEACPTAIIRLVDKRPSLDFSSGECLLCGKCAEACREPVFDRERRFEHVMAVASNCLAHNAVACQSCRDACMPSAIRFRPRLGGPFTPEIDTAACNGCGACITVCPVSAIDIIHLVQEFADA